MENENSRLRIHTTMRRAEAPEPAREPEPRPAVRPRTALTPGERLIRNTAVAGALLLCVLALRNVDQPWSRQAVNGLRQAMTMRVDWDESIGRLSFVRALVPDTALVFLNLNEKPALLQPAGGTVSHGWTEEQPWLEYACEPGAAVIASSDGRVTAAARGMGGDWIVLIEHADSRETLYGYLSDAAVSVGQTVAAGTVIGHAAQADGRLYFELRESGGSVDPTGRFR